MPKRIVRRRIVVPKARLLQNMPNIPQMCTFCLGTGRDGQTPCPICIGRGQLALPLGGIQQMCVYCSGTGREHERPCPICNGVGSLNQQGQPLIKPTVLPGPVFKLPSPVAPSPPPPLSDHAHRSEE